MADLTGRKRPADSLSKRPTGRLPKKQKKSTHSGFQAVDLIDSDGDIDGAVVDDGSSIDSEAQSDDSLDSLNGSFPRQSSHKKTFGDGDSSGDEPFTDSSDGSSEDGETDRTENKRQSLKRNDPTLFSTSLHKILGSKLSTTRRSDPVLSRSADAHEASRRIVDKALEDKARRMLRLQKRAALERGRVKDVLAASHSTDSPEWSAHLIQAEDGGLDSTAKILETERRLRKVAQRGVVKLFNAVRAAQVKAADAERAVKRENLLGMDKREAKVTDMSRKGFLDLIASGGGVLKKGGLEEA